MLRLDFTFEVPYARRGNVNQKESETRERYDFLTCYEHCFSQSFQCVDVSDQFEYPDQPDEADGPEDSAINVPGQKYRQVERKYCKQIHDAQEAERVVSFSVSEEQPQEILDGEYRHYNDFGYIERISYAGRQALKRVNRKRQQGYDDEGVHHLIEEWYTIQMLLNSRCAAGQPIRF